VTYSRVITIRQTIEVGGAHAVRRFGKPPPVRIGFPVSPDDVATISRVARLSCCLWGGRYNPIIAFFESGGERWVRYHREGGLRVARGYIDFFEPDILVESTSGMAEKLGGQGKTFDTGLPRILPLEAFYEKDYRGQTQFAAGIDILKVMQQLYSEEYRYQLRHKVSVVQIDGGTPFFDVVGGRHPDDEALDYIVDTYQKIFEPEKVAADYNTAQNFIEAQYAGPFWITRHSLNETLGRVGISYRTFYVVDPNIAGDLIDYWNFQLVANDAMPVNLEWLPKHIEFIRERIVETHRPIPGNPFGTKFDTTVHFARSILDQQIRDLSQECLSSLPPMAYRPARDPALWASFRGRHKREVKILATAKSVPFDEEIPDSRYVKVPAPAPEFLNVTGRYTKERWITLLMPSQSGAPDDAALVYPSNIWSPDYPHLSNARELRIGREGWALNQEHSIGYSLVKTQSGREAIIEWLKAQGIEAKPSPEGQIATQVITSAGGLLACGMFADRPTVRLLDEMAEGHSMVIRDGKSKAAITPDRSMPIDKIRQHFEDRAKRSFGFWNGLQYFLDRSVFCAGLRVQCRTCAYYNWFDLEAISYTPTCLRCLNTIRFSQAPRDIAQVEWFYRVIGPFAAPGYASGGYAVALTLRCLASHPDTEMTWSTGLILQPHEREVDFFAWHRHKGLLDDERDEPLMLFGEVKSFDRNVFNEETITSFKAVAELFPGILMVASSMREIRDYSTDELNSLRELAEWGRNRTFEGRPRNPLIILTATELFSEHSLYHAWTPRGSAIDNSRPRPDPTELLQLAELTQVRYLGMQGFTMDYHQIAMERLKLVRLLANRHTAPKRV
jgi:hypothetical protein